MEDRCKELCEASAARGLTDKELDELLDLMPAASAAACREIRRRQSKPKKEQKKTEPKSD